MEEARAPRFNPLDHRLWRRVVDQDMIDINQFNRARAESNFVGTCRLCGGHLAPMPTDQEGHLEWFEARCVLCGKEVASPGGRTLRRSSRHTEMPVGWWEYRTDRLAETR